MKELKISIDNKEYLFYIPELWDDLSKDLLLFVMKNLDSIDNFDKSDILICKITNIPVKIYAQLSAVQKFAIFEKLEFLRRDPDFSKLIIQDFVLHKIRFIGYQPGFSNTTWEEFIMADRFFMQGNYAAAAAVLYRPERKKHTGESDIRMPFSVYGTNARLPLFSKLSPELISAIAINYTALRKRNIVEKYPYIFYDSGSNSGGDAGFSWLNVTRSMLGEDFYQEEKLLKSKVHTVLFRLNSLMNPKNKKR